MTVSYWQVSAGAEGRDYSQRFIRHGMAFVGDPKHEQKLVSLNRGDRIVLKRGKSEIVAVGEVIERDGRCVGHGDKEWLRDFDGWNLPAYCFVRWHVPAQPLAIAGLTMGTIKRINHVAVQQVAEDLIQTIPPVDTYHPDPTPTTPVADQQLVEFLIGEGLRPSSAEDLLAAFRRIRLLAKYYYTQCRWSDIREHETRTFLVMPLMLALGWAEQQLKIELGTLEGGRIDVACFAKPYRRDEDGQANNRDCRLIIETKGFDSGLDYAPEQARAYAASFPECQALVVTNGYCYKTFLKNSGGQFELTPHAYLNLLDPRDAYPLDPESVKGALEVLKVMMPMAWNV